MERTCGVLMPIFSLPDKYGIGCFGKKAYEFVDFLAKSGQTVWQVLPLVHTGYGNSPYSSVSADSFNPYFIDLEQLKEQGLITKDEIAGAKISGQYIDYGSLYAIRYPLLKIAFARFNTKCTAFRRFLKEGRFHDYAMFMTIWEKSGYKNFTDWEDGLKYRHSDALEEFEKNNKQQIMFWEYVQFECERQWLKLKSYANKKGVSIMGDIPIYVAWNSVDVWVNPSLYKLDQYLCPTKVAGVPPDYFCATGQLWGNPVYDYDAHKKDGFKWWTERLARTLKNYDFVRIDHFRAFDRYYQVDRWAKDAVNGEWVVTPGRELIDAIHQKVDGSKIIAEDLGIIDDGVRDLLKYAGYPGMKILSFAFNGAKDNLYLPENINENSVCYTGTHDNDTLLGLIENFSSWDYDNLVKGVNDSLKALEINKKVTDNRSLISAIIELGYASKANLIILPLQDILGLDTSYRINEPGTVKLQNWAVKLDKPFMNKNISLRLLNLKKKYNR